MRIHLALTLSLAMATAADAASIFNNEPADYGRPMTQGQCQALARKHVEPFLRNPAAAQYKWGKCEATTMKPYMMQKVPRQSGYGMTFKVNSTNQWGKYTGYTEYVILIHDGQVIRRMRENQNGTLQKY